MIKRLLIVLAVAPLFVACSDACEELAADTCKRVGENTDECRRIKTRAESASADDRRVCSQALAVTRRLTPKN
jgi:hypothetical protein